ncbi:MAG TPA: tRNA pseudouridine(38-40) synthase TruA [Candidatus Limnocylindrales bacterium]|nr:tRNA pseudouridine(38-40) synthase TruA [Candidatus Limnocylindrales bacterium]
MSARKDGSTNGDHKEANRKRAREGGPVRYSARVEYDGTDFAGFQIQSGSRTVQGELERALGRLSGGSRIRVEGAGRTDAGVHARGQVIAFTYRGRLNRDELQQALTALLPRDIGLGTLRKVEAGFRPRYRARYREYRYLVWNGPPSPLRERNAHVVREPLDVEAMAKAATVFVGRHDFSAFGGRDRQPVRTVHEVRVRRQGQRIIIVVIGDAFLRQMVRRMVAALLRVGRGQATAEEVRRELGSSSPAFAGETAPAHGLVLWRVPMGPPHRINEEVQDKRER